jgi:hypothetical protein
MITKPEKRKGDHVCALCVRAGDPTIHITHRPNKAPSTINDGNIHKFVAAFACDPRTRGYVCMTKYNKARTMWNNNQNKNESDNGSDIHNNIYNLKETVQIKGPTQILNPNSNPIDMDTTILVTVDRILEFLKVFPCPKCSQCKLQIESYYYAVNEFKFESKCPVCSFEYSWNNSRKKDKSDRSQSSQCQKRSYDSDDPHDLGTYMSSEPPKKKLKCNDSSLC